MNSIHIRCESLGPSKGALKSEDIASRLFGRTIEGLLETLGIGNRTLDLVSLRRQRQIEDLLTSIRAGLGANVSVRIRWAAFSGDVFEQRPVPYEMKNS